MGRVFITQTFTLRLFCVACQKITEYLMCKSKQFTLGNKIIPRGSHKKLNKF